MDVSYCGVADPYLSSPCGIQGIKNPAKCCLLHKPVSGPACGCEHWLSIMKGGARFEVFRALGLNYYGFHVRKNKIYDGISFVICTTLIGTSLYLGITFVYDWRQSMNLLRYHHARLEVERAQYIKQIKEAREKKLIPPRQPIAGAK